MLVAGVPAQAQWHTVSRSRLDSLANPPMAEGREAMAFERTTVTAEPIEEDGGAKSYIFSWRNEGRTPLVITRVRSTCGCAVAAYDREPVAAGAKGTVTVTYHPKGHPGAFRQRIFLYTQLDDTRPTAVLTLAGGDYTLDAADIRLSPCQGAAAAQARRGGVRGIAPWRREYRVP